MIYHERKKYERFGGRPLVGGRPGARAPCPPPLNPAMVPTGLLVVRCALRTTTTGWGGTLPLRLSSALDIRP